MSPDKVNRERVRWLTDLPNVGPVTAKDFQLLGIQHPEQLVGANALALFQQLCEVTGVRHDPCTLDVFMAAIDFMDGGPAKAWWDFTESRKRLLASPSRR